MLKLNMGINQLVQTSPTQFSYSVRTCSVSSDEKKYFDYYLTSPCFS